MTLLQSAVVDIMKIRLVILSLCLLYSPWISGNPQACPFEYITNAVASSGTCERYPLLPGVKCRFACQRGYTLTGSAERTCQADLIWSGQKPACVAITCPRLARPAVGQIVSDTCTSARSRFDYICALRCPSGYVITNGGNGQTTCLLMGAWSHTLGTCSDVTPPNLRCLPIQLNVDPGKPYATVSSWKLTAPDNSQTAHDPNAQVTMTCSHTFPCRFKIGRTDVSVTATDAAGNAKQCTFKVEVRDVEFPKIVHCPSDIVKESTTEFIRVNWPLPAFSDNSGFPPSITSTHQSGQQFRVGKYEVRYTASDQSGNTNRECKFTVTVKAKACPKFAPPVNGALVCYEHRADRHCIAVCGNGNDFAYDPALLYLCLAGTWNIWGDFIIPTGRRLPWANCTQTQTPSRIKSVPGASKYYFYRGYVSDPRVQQELRQSYINLQRMPPTSKYFPPNFCALPNCKTENIKIYPGKVSS